jgi:D-galactarolactone cycloisomerase
VSRIVVSRIEARVYRCPIETPVRTSFGIMRDRPAVLVEVADSDGAVGWGEVWCNFPTVGAEHRARLVQETLAPLLLKRPFAGPAEAYRHLTAALEVLAIQSGEPGPLAQAIAGLDMALWDLTARRAGRPLCSFLGGGLPETVPVYASGINPDAPETLVAEKLAEGHRAFKLKVGFGAERDLGNLARVRQRLGSAATLMIDANQAWDLDTAIDMSRKAQPFALAWIEEPLRADAAIEDWQQLADVAGVALAAGENMRGERAFESAITGNVLQVIQPDVGKWGGFTGCLPVARATLAAGKNFCPHWLGGGIGLIGSLHLLAAAGGDGLLEVDTNPNPLRELMATPLPEILDGRMAVPRGPGLGVEPDLAALERYRV